MQTIWGILNGIYYVLHVKCPTNEMVLFLAATSVVRAKVNEPKFSIAVTETTALYPNP